MIFQKVRSQCVSQKIEFGTKRRKEHNDLIKLLGKCVPSPGLKSYRDPNWGVFMGTLGSNYDGIKLGITLFLGWVYY